MLQWIAKQLLQRLPPHGITFVRRVKFYVMGRLSPQAYWNFAASTCATAAISTDCVDEKHFFELGKQEAVLLHKLELLHPKVRVLQKVPAGNVTFQLVNGRSLEGIETGSFDLCFSFLVFQHLPRPVVSSYFSEVARVLRPGGLFFFQLPLAAEDLHPDPPSQHPFGMRYYTVDQVLGLIRQQGLRFMNRYDSEGHPVPTDGLLHPNFEFFLAGRSQANS